MNRHQRRAQAKAGVKPLPGPAEKAADENDRPVAGTAGRGQPSGIPRRPGILLRVFARILLSKWVVNRLRHPEAERLVISFAREAGRHDVADQIVRRQALRKAGA
jgi:hypothetical protein